MRARRVSDCFVCVGTSPVSCVNGPAFRYKAKVPNQATTYILVEARHAYTIIVSQSTPPNYAMIAAIVGGVVVLVLLLCCVFSRTFRKARDNNEMIRVNSFMCYFISAMMCIGPVVLIIVGAALASTAPAIGTWMPVGGGVWLFVVFSFCGHKTLELDARAKTVKITKYFFVAYPRHTVYQMSNVLEFYVLQTTTYSNNGVSRTDQAYVCVGATALVSRQMICWMVSIVGAHCVPFHVFRRMRMMDGRTIAIDTGSSNFGGFGSRVPQFNAFLVKADPDTPRQNGLATAAKVALNPLGQATVARAPRRAAPAPTPQVSTGQQQLAALQQQQVAMMQQQQPQRFQQQQFQQQQFQQQQFQQPVGGGYNPQPAAAPYNAYAAASSLPPPSAAATGGAFVGGALPMPSAPPSRGRRAPPPPGSQV